MNDIHITFFILASLYTYLLWKDSKQKYMLLLSGILAGVSASTKWSGVFVIGIFFLDQLITLARAWFQKKQRPAIKQVLILPYVWLMVPIAI